jgi:uncharacterized membrane protein YeaQ/YmgE (transglycosylase-associated protein family)
VDVVVFLVVLAVYGLVLGSLARLAVPGPDPMPIWRTILLGLAGSFVGGIVAALLGVGADPDTGSMTASFVAALAGTTILLLLYRRFLQHRPITGPRAHERPGA